MSPPVTEGSGAPAFRAPWPAAAIYQVYVKSFADSDGDGLGDLDGVTSKLDYLVDLGVDGIWLTPCYPTPDRDGGYDVADYFTIAERYGGTKALVGLLAAAHGRGLRVMMDIVPNHCSAEHEWFQAALAEPPGGVHRERFFFRDGRGADGREPPNNWTSIFGGPAWTRIREQTGERGQWYLHLFDPGQPDFDWRSPAVAEHFEHVLRHWFDLGVDGFRIDVAHGLLKAASLPDFDLAAGGVSPTTNQPEVHEVYRSWRAIADSYLPARELTFVAEAWAPTPTDMALYVRAGELQQTFYFDLVMQPWDAGCFRASVSSGLAALAEIRREDQAGGAMGTYAWTLNNHDVFRSVTRFGIVERSPRSSPDRHADAVRPAGRVDVELGRSRARAAALFLLGLPGPPYVYQGEELGLPEVLDLPDDSRQDPIWRLSGGTDPGRDGCRVPLPWTPDGPTLGFSPETRDAAPWLPQPPSFTALAASSQASDPGSTLTLYRDALRLRRTLFSRAAPELEWVEVSGRDDVVAYRRGDVTVVTNFGSEPFPIPSEWGNVELSSAPSSGNDLPGASAAWIGAR